MEKLKLYPKMNEKIVGILRLPGDPEEPVNQVHLYAAQLIEEQAAALAAYCASGLSPEQCAELATLHQQGVPFTLPPLEIGDRAWVIRDFKGTRKPVAGIICDMYFIRNMELIIRVSHVGRGQFGKKVFATCEDAWDALEKGSLDEID